MTTNEPDTNGERPMDVWAATNVGRVRKDNEDALLVDEALGLFVVADGMGGHAAGEVASQLAVETVREHLLASRDKIEAFARATGEVRRTDILRLLEASVLAACGKVHSEADKDSSKRGMGTTLDVLLVAGNRGFVAHVGDSRIYLGRQGSVHQLTEDHSLINELLRRGRLSRDQIEQVQYKNAVTRAVGVYASVEVDTLDFDLLAGDCLLLCSDGLHGYLEESELPGLLDAEEHSELVPRLINLANERGGKDNITAVVVRIPAAPSGVDRLTTRVNLKLETLHRMRLFRHLTYTELVRLLNHLEAKEYKTGARLCDEGADGDELFIVLSGRVTIHSGSKQLSELGPGEHVGELALVDGAPRTASATAKEPCEVLVLRRRQFFEVVRRDHDLAIKLLWSFLSVTTDRMRRVSEESARSRFRVSTDEVTTRFRIDDSGSVL